MIIYGSRMYGKNGLVGVWGTCDHCGHYSRQSCYYGRKFGHIYFIPLIPMGGRVRVLFECGNCSMGSHVPEENVRAIVEGLLAGLEPCIAAAAEGRDEYEDDDGDPVHTGAQLAGAVRMLYACDSGEEVATIADRLPEDSQALHLLDAAEHELNGRVPEAIQAFKRAATVRRDDVVPLVMLGALCKHNGRKQEARDIYERAHSMEPESGQIVGALADLSEALKDWEGVCEWYEKLFALLPSLRANKELLKKYKKACKKCGRDPVAVT